MQDFHTISYRSVSRLTDPVSDLVEILSESQVRNKDLGITGLLLYDGYFFMQTIEGPPDEVVEVFLKILRDKRHMDVAPFLTKSIRERQFPDWRMKLIGPAVTARIVPDMADFDFSEHRLAQVHEAAHLASRAKPNTAVLWN